MAKRRGGQSRPISPKDNAEGRRWLVGTAIAAAGVLVSLGTWLFTSQEQHTSVIVAPEIRDASSTNEAQQLPADSPFHPVPYVPPVATEPKIRFTDRGPLQPMKDASEAAPESSEAVADALPRRFLRDETLAEPFIAGDVDMERWRGVVARSAMPAAESDREIPRRFNSMSEENEERVDHPK